MTRTCSANIADWISEQAAQYSFDIVVAHSDLAGLQEFGNSRDHMLRKTGRLHRGPVVFPRKPQGEWTWARPLLGGGPVGARASTGQLKSCHAVRLVGPGRVEGTAEAGVPRRGRLPSSWATVTRWTDDLVVINVHLTAEVQRGKSGYRTDMPRRVARHKRERAALQRLVGKHRSKGRRVIVVGDTNYHQMPIPGLTGWWEHVGFEDTGTEGNRAIDVVSDSAGVPAKVRILTTKSDHRHPVASD